MKDMMRNCSLCPRNCQVDRTMSAKGCCGQSIHLTVARAALHFGEEPCISGCCGSGAVFFAGCSLIMPLPTQSPTILLPYIPYPSADWLKSFWSCKNKAPPISTLSLPDISFRKYALPLRNPKGKDLRFLLYTIVPVMRKPPPYIY